MKINPAIKKQFISLAKELPPVGAHVLFLRTNKLDGDEWVVSEVKGSIYCTEIKTGEHSYVTCESQKRLNRKSYPYIRLIDGSRVVDGKFIILAR